MMASGWRRSPRQWVTVIQVVLGSVLAFGVPQIARAGHCSYCSQPLPDAAHLLATSIPSDGVLAFYLSDQEGHDVRFALSFLQITVTDASGASIPGELEVREGFAVAAWRPDAPWVPGSSVRVAWTIDLDHILTEVFGSPPRGCPAVEDEQEIEILTDPLAPVRRPRVSFQAYTETEPSRSLETFVCCDGSHPRLVPPEEQPGSCVTGSVLSRGPGHCGSLRGIGRVFLAATMDEEGLNAAQLANLAVRLAAPQDDVASAPAAVVTLSGTAPFCATFEILDLARDSVEAFESCAGEDVLSQLGDVEHDPLPALEACEGEPYVCEVVDLAWDPGQCRPWPDTPDRGCRCRAGQPSSAVGWVWGLVLLIRRRRRCGA